jgi:hypothetical protein
MTADQQKTFELLWPTVRKGGIYVMEDLHTSYIPSFCNATKNTHEFIKDSGIRHEVFLGRERLDESVTCLIYKDED